MLKPLEKKLCILYLNTFKISIFVFSKYIKYFVPVNLFMRVLISCINYRSDEPPPLNPNIPACELQLYNSIQHWVSGLYGIR